MSTPRVLVLQPILPPRAPVDTRVLGIQKWLVEELSALGCETVSTLAKSDLAPELAALPHPSDSMLLGLLRRSGSSHGVVLSFAVEDARPHLTAARLVEAPLRGPLRDVGRWSLDADADHLPSVAHSLLAAIAGALGREARGKTWQESFGVGTREAADNYLTALGCLAAIADGITSTAPERALQAAVWALSGAHVGGGSIDRPAELLRRLVTLLHERGADLGMLQTAVMTAIHGLGEVPASWQRLVTDIGIARSGRAN